MTAGEVRVARVYDPAGADDGARVLADRLWPRGLAKADAPFETWCRAVAPSTGLRRWYGHDPELRAEFGRRYRAELAAPDAAAGLRELAALRRDRGLTLLTATRDLQLSHLTVLAELLTEG